MVLKKERQSLRIIRHMSEKIVHFLLREPIHCIYKQIETIPNSDVEKWHM